MDGSGGRIQLPECGGEARVCTEYYFIYHAVGGETFEGFTLSNHPGIETIRDTTTTDNKPGWPSPTLEYSRIVVEDIS